jgi:hypothetical protein
MQRTVSVDSDETLTASPAWTGGTIPARQSAPERAVFATGPLRKRGTPEMSREEAYASCPDDSYVELYGNQWLIVPFAPIEQPRFFVCTPGNTGVAF